LPGPECGAGIYIASLFYSNHGRESAIWRDIERPDEQVSGDSFTILQSAGATRFRHDALLIQSVFKKTTCLFRSQHLEVDEVKILRRISLTITVRTGADFEAEFLAA
jgi:hypothetical protein